MTSSLLPLELRLRSLEAQLFGVPPSLLSDPDSPSSTSLSALSTPPVTRRILNIAQGLHQLGESSDGVKRLLEGYEQYLPLLAIPTAGGLSANASSSDSNPTSSSTEPPNPTPTLASAPTPIHESSLLPDSVKLAMILEAASDIRGAERDLREIEILKSRQVEGSGELEQLLPLRPNLIQAMQEVSEESRQVEHARKNVGQLLLRYNDFVRPALSPVAIQHSCPPPPNPNMAETDSNGSFFFKQKKRCPRYRNYSLTYITRWRTWKKVF
ncbi:hypothetical protein C345_04188 [Cryptococcus neoformans A2-102-5]|nr:hypothetical protein C346_04299 [Cryptococcus neoformans var. grubii D17-1]OXG94561.1 hypothetical protein C345_04188 [Cryptococcus neoformans var. grubii A2-102-5]